MSAPAAVAVVDQDGHRHYFDADVHAALVNVGLIRRDGDRWRFDSREMPDLFPFPELAVCDFCHARPVTWDIDAETFDARLVEFTSVAGWAACEPCGQAIVAKDRRALQRRVLAWARQTTSSRSGPDALWIARVARLLDILDQFWRHFKSIRRYASPYREQP